jgi:hypothetical protein
MMPDELRQRMAERSDSERLIDGAMLHYAKPRPPQHGSTA